MTLRSVFKRRKRLVSAETVVLRLQCFSTINYVFDLYLPRQTLTDLLAKAEGDQEALAAARYLSDSGRQTRLEEIAAQRKAWRMDAVRDAMQAAPDDLQTEVRKLFEITNYHKKHYHEKVLAKTFHLNCPETQKLELPFTA